MAQVFEIFVERTRSAQPKDYESSAAKCALKAHVDDGEDWEKAATDLMAKARDVVYETIGIRPPAAKGQDKVTPPANITSPEDAHAQGQAAQAAARDAKTQTTSPKTETKEEKPAAKKRGPGRPSKAELKAREEAEKKAAEEAEAAGTNGDNDDDIPDDTSSPKKEEAEAAGKRADAEAKRQASKAAAKAKADDDIPDDGESTATPAADETGEELSYSELQQTMSKMITDRLIGVDAVKALVAEFGVERVKDLDDKQRPAFLAKLKENAKKPETAEA